MGPFNNARTLGCRLRKSVEYPQDGTPLFFGSIKRKSATEGTPTSPPAVGGGTFSGIGGGATSATVHLPPPVAEEDGLSGTSGSRRGSEGSPPKYEK